MKENDVAFFGTLLNESEENVKQFAEEGTLGDKVKALGMMDKAQVETLKANYAKEVKDSYLGELSEAAKKGEVPQDLYKPIHGAVLEKTEKALSKKYEVMEYDSFDDLVDKAINKHKGQSDDQRVADLTSLVDELKGANTKLVTEKEEAEARIKAQFENQIMSRDMNDHISKVPFDFSDVEEDKLEEAQASRREILNSVFASRYNTVYQDGKIVVTDKEGNVVKNSATLDPVPVSNVLLDVAKGVGLKLTSPESGGQGGTSTGKNGSRFKDEADFREHCKANGIVPTSPEGIALLKESGLKLY